MRLHVGAQDGIDAGLIARSRRNQRSRSASSRMVTASFGVGSTTWADFQNAASVPWRRDQRQSPCGSLPAYGGAGQTSRSSDQLSRLRALPELHWFSSLLAQPLDAFAVLASFMPKPISIREFAVLP
jgi:hypothetical protein